jgi:hypothetical protein
MAKGTNKQKVRNSKAVPINTHLTHTGSVVGAVRATAVAEKPVA